MISSRTIEKFVINFLVYNKKHEIGEAAEMFRDNEEHFVKVFNILGNKFLDMVGENIKQ